MSYPDLIRIKVLDLCGSFPSNQLFEHSLAGLSHLYKVRPIQVSVTLFGSTTITFSVQTSAFFITPFHRMRNHACLGLHVGTSSIRYAFCVCFRIISTVLTSPQLNLEIDPPYLAPICLSWSVESASASSRE
jgi:hypothetical protein